MAKPKHTYTWYAAILVDPPFGTLRSEWSIFDRLVFKAASPELAAQTAADAFGGDALVFLHHLDEYMNEWWLCEAEDFHTDATTLVRRNREWVVTYEQTLEGLIGAKAAKAAAAGNERSEAQ